LGNVGRRHRYRTGLLPSLLDGFCSIRCRRTAVSTFSTNSVFSRRGLVSSVAWLASPRRRLPGGSAMTVRRILIVAAAFVMPISGCGRSPAPTADAQRPPDPLQEKMGRAPNESGDGRQIASSALPEATAAIEEARNKLRTLLGAKEREF